MEQEASCDEIVECDLTDILPECIPAMQAAVSPPPSPPSPPAAAQILSDPHFMGLDGQSFDFLGRAGEIYLILGNSEDNGLALISRFGTAYTSSISFDPSTNRLLPYKRTGVIQCSRNKMTFHISPRTKPTHSCFSMMPATQCGRHRPTF